MSNRSASVSTSHLSYADKRALVLLVALYTLQGVPIGLAFGSIPYLLRAKLSYSQIGVFTLSTYPYSLKLLWSPIVDSYFHPKIGRRKSWILPMQIIIGLTFWWFSSRANDYFDVQVPAVGKLTLIFFMLIFFAATQDIAVDGWALTLVSKNNLPYTSTAQTVGIKIGYFLSFTVFLAFNSTEFSNKYIRSVPSDTPILSLGGYMGFWAVMFFIVTIYIALYQAESPNSVEDKEKEEEDIGVKKVYQVMWSIIRLPHIQTFLIIHLVAKIGAATNEVATSLKLVEKGFSKEDLGLAALINFPFQIVFGWLAADILKTRRPLDMYMLGMYAQVGFAVLAMLLVASYPSGKNQVSSMLVWITILFNVLSNFASTLTLVAISAFHAHISDPMIGGTYMTLLYTFSNLGGTWPNIFVLSGIDWMTEATCHVPAGNSEVLVRASECVSDHGKAACAGIGGTCVTEKDGYYRVNTLCVVIGAMLLWRFVGPRVQKLQGLPLSAWRVRTRQ